jgi:hypothetical protein
MSFDVKQPFDHSCGSGSDSGNKAYRRERGGTGSGQPLTIVLQVYSRGLASSRLRLEGVGYVTLPDDDTIETETDKGADAASAAAKGVGGRTMDVEVKTWRPIGEGVRSQMNEYFLGSAPHLRDARYAEIPDRSRRPSTSSAWLQRHREQ